MFSRTFICERCFIHDLIVLSVDHALFICCIHFFPAPLLDWPLVATSSVGALAQSIFFVGSPARVLMWSLADLAHLTACVHYLAPCWLACSLREMHTCSLSHSLAHFHVLTSSLAHVLIGSLAFVLTSAMAHMLVSSMSSSLSSKRQWGTRWALPNCGVIETRNLKHAHTHTHFQNLDVEEKHVIISHCANVRLLTRAAACAHS